MTTATRQRGLFGRFLGWLDAMPHPNLACEIAPGHVAAARGTRGRLALDGFAVEPLAGGVISPSPVELNLADADAVRSALNKVLARIHAHGREAALLVPDPAVRVFILHFDTFPRRADDAVPFLRWRLKKSVPFDVEETVVSYISQPAPAGGLDVFAALARHRIIRQYEEVLERVGLVPGVVLGSTLATLPLLEDGRATLLARMSGTTLTTVIVRQGALAVYRCTEMPADAARLETQALLDEIYPALAYYQDTWHENVGQIRLAGFSGRLDQCRRVLEGELGCAVTPLAASAALEERLSGEAKALVDKQLEALVGWMMNRGA